ncbi:hypothetical protein ACFQDE_09475 [Deinococcus caeni]|uniref:hypothetical protein n=1 Tax=Deinococcus caeni TaxID=569127 RepID=UPI003616AABE
MTDLDLGGGYSARPISLEAYRAACARLEDRIFGGNSLYAFDPRCARPRPPASRGTGACTAARN